jgi:hypothetical protein
MVENVTSPYVVGDLLNGRNYWFQLESVADTPRTMASVFSVSRANDDSSANAISDEEGTRPDRLFADGPVNAIAQDADGVTYLGGNFTLVGMRASYGLTLSAGTGHVGAFPFVNDIVRVAVSDGAGGFYIGGDFTEVDSLPRNRLAHILANGTLGSWNPDAGSSVDALAFSGDTVYVGGSFSSIDDMLANLDLNTLNIPGTDRPIGEIEDELVEETASTGEDTDTDSFTFAIFYQTGQWLGILVDYRF